jgi:hypothetical protein
VYSVPNRDHSSKKRRNLHHGVKYTPILSYPNKLIGAAISALEARMMCMMAGLNNRPMSQLSRLSTTHEEEGIYNSHIPEHPNAGGCTPSTSIHGGA